jgi:hypothetical protein
MVIMPYEEYVEQSKHFGGKTWEEKYWSIIVCDDM